MADIYEIVTNRILDQLDKGIIPWQKPWTGGHDGAYNYVTGKAYSILNQILLNHADAYLTFNQVKQLGGKVKKGAKSEIVTFWKQLPIETEDKEGNKTTKTIPFLRYYTVFWIGDTEGIERKDLDRVKNDPIQAAEDIITGYMTSENHPKLERDTVTDKAYYDPTIDLVKVPTIDQYNKISEYYSTLFHELTHSTGSKSRLGRLENTAFFGNEEYSKEELVAEIGAATLVNIAGIETEKSFNNSAAYIQGWSRKLRENKKMIVEASSKAAKAVEYITAHKPEDTDPTDSGDKKAPEKENKTNKPATKNNTQKAFDQIVKNGYKLHTALRLSGTYNNISYACDSHQLMRTTEATPEDNSIMEKIEAERYDKIIQAADKDSKTGSINISLKDFRAGIKEAKQGKRGAKVMYTTPEGITFNANYILNALIATGNFEYKYTNKKAPAIFRNDNTEYIVLPIISKEDNKEGFKAIA